MLHRFGLIAILITALATSSAGAFFRLTKQDADRFNAKLTRIVDFGNKPAVKTATAAPSQTTQITDNEVTRFPSGLSIPRSTRLVTAAWPAGPPSISMPCARRSSAAGWIPWRI